MQLTKDNYFLFSGGEVHCSSVGGDGTASTLVCLDYTMNGFMAICQFKEILDREGVNVNLVYPYFPYARQDRLMSDSEPFSLKVFCELLNTRNFNCVTIFDPHSDVCSALINNVRILPQWKIVSQVLPKAYFSNPEVLFVSPDAGAYKKLSKLIPDDQKIIIGVKNRDITGIITHTDVFSKVSLDGKICIIIDDICDGGRTFIELAKALKEKGAGQVILYVTHGIFSKGFSELDHWIDHIYTTDSFPQTGPQKLITTTSIYKFNL